MQLNLIREIPETVWVIVWLSSCQIAWNLINWNKLIMIYVKLSLRSVVTKSGNFSLPKIHSEILYKKLQFSKLCRQVVISTMSWCTWLWNSYNILERQNRIKICAIKKIWIKLCYLLVINFFLLQIQVF